MQQANTFIQQVFAVSFLSFGYILFIFDNTQEFKLIDIRFDKEVVPSYPSISFQIHMKHYLPKYFKTINQAKPKEALDYVNLEFNYGNIKDYHFLDEIGSGASATAYHGQKISTKEKVVIKTFSKMKMRGIKKEIALLQTVQNHKNIVPIHDILYNKERKEISIVSTSYNNPIKVYLFIENTYTSDLFAATNAKGNQYFLQELLKGINHAHSLGVIHGDIKPLNIVANAKGPMLKLIDWGLGNFYVPGKIKSVNIGTKSYKSPELLVKYPYYDYQIDVFAAGLIFSRMVVSINLSFQKIFRKGPFFRQSIDSDNNEPYLMRLVEVLGMKNFKAYLEKYQISYEFSSPEWNTRKQLHSSELVYSFEKKSFESYINDENKKYCSPEALDLLEKMLTYDPSLRITARDALQHSYFDQVRDM